MLKDMYHYFSHLFDTQGWVPRWVCGRWTEVHGWTYIISSLLIGVAYFAIPFILFRFIRKVTGSQVWDLACISLPKLSNSMVVKWE